MEKVSCVETRLQKDAAQSFYALWTASFICRIKLMCIHYMFLYQWYFIGRVYVNNQFKALLST